MWQNVQKLFKNKAIRIVAIILAALFALGCLAVLVPNIIVLSTTTKQLGADPVDDATALILGAKVHKDGRLSDMLRDRMDTGIALYHEGKVQKLLLSGDDSGVGEVRAMKAYALEHGVAEEDILCDGEGYSTYESVTRAKNMFDEENLVIVTQKYHLYRALYTANDMNLTAVGADAALFRYRGQLYRDVRELLARAKDFVLCLVN